MTDKPVSRRTILVVDDDEGFRQVMAFELKRAGFEVQLASGGLEALAIAKAQELALIISDLKMPEGDGITLLKELRQRDRHAPKLVFVSGYSELTLEEAFDLGAEAVIHKPFGRAELHAAIERVLRDVDAKWPSRPTRFPVDLAVTLEGLGPNPRLVNVGRGGFFVRSDGPFPALGAELSFSLALAPEERPISGTGIVRWCRREPTDELPAGLGVEFAHFEPGCRERMFEFVNALATSSYIPRKG